MSDLALIVDLRPLADHGVADAAAINRSSGTDLDIVLDNDTAGLREPSQAWHGDEAKTVLPDAAARMNRDPVAD